MENQDDLKKEVATSNKQLEMGPNDTLSDGLRQTFYEYI